MHFTMYFFLTLSAPIQRSENNSCFIFQPAKKRPFLLTVFLYQLFLHSVKSTSYQTLSVKSTSSAHSNFSTHPSKYPYYGHKPEINCPNHHFILLCLSNKKPASTTISNHFIVSFIVYTKGIVIKTIPTVLLHEIVVSVWLCFLVNTDCVSITRTTLGTTAVCTRKNYCT